VLGRTLGLVWRYKAGVTVVQDAGMPGHVTAVLNPEYTVVRGAPLRYPAAHAHHLRLVAADADNLGYRPAGSWRRR
jgi:hypothetical protein